MTTERVRVSGLGWVLPFGAGAGLEILAHPEWLDWREEHNVRLGDFNVRPYLNSVKGYLDPATAYCLAAAVLALGWSAGRPTASLRDDAGVCTLTRYGAPQSGYRFFEQLVRKGPRFASPLIFPHGYSNSAGNLAAIEFGFGGPHMVYYGDTEIAEALAFALARLRDGSATDMLVGTYEAGLREALPDVLKALSGGIVLWLSTCQSSPELLTTNADALTQALPAPAGEYGSVHAMLWLLQHLA